MTTPPPSDARPIGLAAALLGVVTRVPASREPPAADPAARSRSLARVAQAKSAAVSAAAALPPGPIGWVTLAPELVVIWRIQSQLVADLAAAHGRHHALGPELLLHCLFAHSLERPLGGLVARVGERLLVRTASYRALQPLVRSIAERLARRTLARGAGRFVPVAGSAALAGWAWRETGRVAASATEAFAHEIVVAPADEPADEPAGDGPA
jgi:hypothetical protein